MKVDRICRSPHPLPPPPNSLLYWPRLSFLTELLFNLFHIDFWIIVVWGFQWVFRTVTHLFGYEWKILLLHGMLVCVNQRSTTFFRIRIRGHSYEVFAGRSSLFYNLNIIFLYRNSETRTRGL